MANPNFGTLNHPSTIADQASFDICLRTHMVRVYNYMAAGLALSGMVAFGLFSSAELASLSSKFRRAVSLAGTCWAGSRSSRHLAS
jgi:FtsH-binding integral membrane protein